MIFDFCIAALTNRFISDNTALSDFRAVWAIKQCGLSQNVSNWLPQATAAHLCWRCFISPMICGNNQRRSWTQICSLLAIEPFTASSHAPAPPRRSCSSTACFAWHFSLKTRSAWHRGFLSEAFTKDLSVQTPDSLLITDFHGNNKPPLSGTTTVGSNPRSDTVVFLTRALDIRWKRSDWLWKDAVCQGNLGDSDWLEITWPQYSKTYKAHGIYSFFRGGVTYCSEP